MHSPHHNHRAAATTTTTTAKSHSTLASCLLATLFLLILISITFLILFLLFKPKSPIITLTSLQFPSFTLSNTTHSLNFTLSQFISLHNPNRIFPFSHYDSTLLLFVHGTQLGSLFIPAGNVPAGGTQLIEATFDVKGCEVGDGMVLVVEMEMRVKVMGKLRVLRVFAHRVGNEVRCWVTVEVADGTVLGVRC